MLPHFLFVPAYWRCQLSSRALFIMSTPFVFTNEMDDVSYVLSLNPGAIVLKYQIKATNYGSTPPSLEQQCVSWLCWQLELLLFTLCLGGTWIESVSGFWRMR